GQYVACGYNDGAVGPVLTQKSGSQSGMQWSSDSQFIVCSGSANVVQAWKVSGENAILGKGTLFSLSLNRKRLVTANSYTGALRLYDDRGKLLKEVRGSQPIRALSWHPTGTRFAMGKDDSNIRLFSAEGKPLASFPAQKVRIGDLAFSPDGKWLASTGGYGDADIRFWKPDGTAVRTVHGPSRGVTWLSWSADSQWLATANFHSEIRLWKYGADDSQLVYKQPGSSESMTGVAFSHQHLRLAAQDYGPTLHVWDIGSSPKAVLETKRGGRFAWKNQSEELTIGTSPLTALTLNGPAEWSGKVRVAGSSTQLRWSPDDRQLALATNRGLFVWNGDVEKQPVRITPFRTDSVQWKPDGSALLAGTGAGEIVQWNAESLESEWVVLPLPEGKALTLSASGKTLHGDSRAIDEHCVIHFEDDQGEWHSAQPSKFWSRFGAK
ncbi:MAG: WD40 repeat domain-containing protein, partial [Planctomycetales bacterium]